MILHIMQHYHALDIRVLTVAKSAVVEAPSQKRQSRETRQRRASMLVLTNNGLDMSDRGLDQCWRCNGLLAPSRGHTIDID